NGKDWIAVSLTTSWKEVMVAEERIKEMVNATSAVHGVIFLMIARLRMTSALTVES
ncbi:hypothetical protein A2U01_0097207, partial [Trifolium medium]|nr:hypothetical protein [Trifolium medium]